MKIISTHYVKVTCDSGIDYERKDCVVRTMSLALNKPYAEMHEACRVHGRPDCKGTPHHTVEAVAGHYGMVEVVSMRLPECAETLAHFLRAHPVGRFYVQRNGHAFAVIDGVVHDWARTKTGPRSRVVRAFQAP